jgi:hypothetical protein
MAATMVKIRLLIDVIVCIILIKEDGGVAMHWLVRGVPMNVGCEIALVAAICELNLNVSRVNLLQTTIIRGVV